MGPKLDTTLETTVGFHGTSRSVAEEVMRNSFKMSHPEAKPLLGVGVYFFDQQFSQAKRWAKTNFGRDFGNKYAVIQSRIRYGRLLNLADKEQQDAIRWFQENYARKVGQDVSMSVAIDIAAEQLEAQTVKALRVPKTLDYLTPGWFSADVEVILAVRDTNNILSKEIILSEMTTR